MINAYNAIAAKAEEIGWPIAYRTDLTVHDLRRCLEMAPSAAFLWILRECGTHMYLAHPELDGVDLESDLVSLEKHLGPCRYFWWDAGQTPDDLEELTDVEEACRVLEDRVGELRARDRREHAAQ